MSARMAGHAIHYAHRKPATHASVVCKWTCVAGQVVGSGGVDLPGYVASCVLLDARAPGEPGDALPSFSASRGPPSPSS